MDAFTKVIIFLTTIWLGCGLLGYILTRGDSKKKPEERGCLYTIGFFLGVAFIFPLQYIIGFAGFALVIFILAGLIKLLIILFGANM